MFHEVRVVPHVPAVVLKHQVPVVLLDSPLECLHLRLADPVAIFQVLDFLQVFAVGEQELDALHGQVLRVLHGQLLQPGESVLCQHVADDVIADAGAHADEDLAHVVA